MTDAALMPFDVPALTLMVVARGVGGLIHGLTALILIPTPLTNAPHRQKTSEGTARSLGCTSRHRAWLIGKPS
ncbi:hypothetical protein FHS42_001359 [Streptomyces zagrosensis]|uniref:Uncharacterized protein n=1 Tax=Streptomyces zagrosensis TaxID=1042984 RepID=A0A7W9Q703_9ACTN|nr:hypothetical protein [Streptomyces zagrosensis]